MSRHEAPSFRRFLSTRWTLGISIALCAFIFFQLIQVVQKSASTDKEIKLLQKESDQLGREQKDLEKMRSFLQTDYFAESEARTKFGYAKKGEATVIISDSAEESSANTGKQTRTQQAQNSDTDYSASSGRMRAWWQYFFGPHDFEPIK